MRTLLYALTNEARLEFRRGYVLGGLLVFAMCVIYIIYLCLAELPPAIWIALYWIAFLFLGVYMSMRTFTRESKRRYLYYYTIMSPEMLFSVKCIFNVVVLLLLGLVMYGGMSLFLGNPIQHKLLFLGILSAGALCIALAFTFVSAIAVKSDQGVTLMTIMSFPAIIPVLLNVVRLSQQSLSAANSGNTTTGFLVLGAIAFLLLGLGFLMFPYLWRS